MSFVTTLSTRLLIVRGPPWSALSDVVGTLSSRGGALLVIVEAIVTKAYPLMINRFGNFLALLVGRLSGYVTEDELRSFFQGFGEITYVKIPSGKGCGLVQFVHRHAAEMAINQMQAAGTLKTARTISTPSTTTLLRQGFNPMQPMNQFTNPNNTTVFVGGLSGYVTEDELQSFFQGFGKITYVKILLSYRHANTNPPATALLPLPTPHETDLPIPNR
jgi:hypothetical protein